MMMLMMKVLKILMLLMINCYLPEVGCALLLLLLFQQHNFEYKFRSLVLIAAT